MRGRVTGDGYEKGYDYYTRGGNSMYKSAHGKRLPLSKCTEGSSDNSKQQARAATTAGQELTEAGALDPGTVPGRDGVLGGDRTGAVAELGTARMPPAPDRGVDGAGGGATGLDAADLAARARARAAAAGEGWGAPVPATSAAAVPSLAVLSRSTHSRGKSRVEWRRWGDGGRAFRRESREAPGWGVQEWRVCHDGCHTFVTRNTAYTNLQVCPMGSREQRLHLQHVLCPWALASGSC
jgi:hypothetical protein